MFYVYEHIRPDTGAIFYVGKGSGNRCNVSQHRNVYWQRIVNKAKGFSVRKIVESIDEELAFLIESERICQLKELGIKLCNMTEGGEGASGFKHTEVSKLRMREAKLGKKLTESHKKNIGAGNRGKWSKEEKEKLSNSRKGMVFTEEHKRNISKGRKGVGSGKPCPENVKEAARKANKGNQVAKGRIWVNNGILSKMVYPEMIPDGFTKGRVYGR